MLHDEFIKKLKAAEIPFFMKVDDCLTRYGYVPKQSKTKDVIFVYRRKGKNIAKFTIDARGNARMYLKYYAVSDPDVYFRERIRIVMEEFDFRYTGMIPGAIEGVGYTYRYPDGRDYFLFHSEMIDVGIPGVAELAEIDRLVSRQNAWWDEGKP